MLYSYEFANIKRDLSPDLALILKDSPLLISLINVGERVTNIKHEWIEDALESDMDTSAAILLPLGTVLQVNHAEKYRVNAQVKYEDYDEVMRVISVSGSNMTVERDWGGFGKLLGGTGTAASGADLRIVARPRPEAEDHGTDESHLVSAAYNAIGIVERYVKVPLTVENLQHYAISDFLEYQVSLREKAIVRELNEWLIYSVRNLATSAVAGQAVNAPGGLNYFHSLAGTDKIISHASSATLSQGMLNDIIEEIVLAGGSPDTILCNTAQGRAISALNKAYLQVARQDTQAGQVVYTFQSDLQNLGLIQNIVIDVTYPKNKIAVFERSKIQMKPFEPLYDVDATPAGADYVARQMRGKYTFEFKNAKETIGIVDELA